MLTPAQNLYQGWMAAHNEWKILPRAEGKTSARQLHISMYLEINKWLQYKDQKGNSYLGLNTSQPPGFFSFSFFKFTSGLGMALILAL